MPSAGLLLLASDLSPLADRITAPAADLCRRAGLGLMLLHVVPDPELAPALAQNVGRDVAEAQQHLQALAAGLPVAASVEVRSSEDVVETILQCLQQKGAAFLAIATQGKTGWQRLRLGSVADALVRRSPVPVICFPSAR